MPSEFDELARECADDVALHGTGVITTYLARAAEQATKAERERCAGICDEKATVLAANRARFIVDKFYTQAMEYLYGEEAAKAIANEIRSGK